MRALVLALTASAALSAWGIMPYAGMADGREEQGPFRLVPGNEAVISSDASAVEQEVEIAASMPGNRNGKGDAAQWMISGLDAEGECRFSITLSWGSEGLDEAFSRRYLQISADTVASQGRCVEVLRNKIYDDVDLYNGVNVLTVVMRDGVVAVWVGNDHQRDAGSFGCSAVSAFRLHALGLLDVDYFVSAWAGNPARELQTGLNGDDILRLTHGASGAVGVWHFLDRDTDSGWAEPGGMYRLAVVPHIDSGNCGYKGRQPVYDVLYLGGARVGSAHWAPGMVKARMYATPFENHYDVVWFDARMEWMGAEVSADFISPSILAFHFPLHKSHMRFTRME